MYHQPQEYPQLSSVQNQGYKIIPIYTPYEKV